MADLKMWQIMGIEPSNNPDILQLQELVWEIREILKDVVDNPRPAIPWRHHTRLKAAWEEAARNPSEGNDRFSLLVKNLDGKGTSGESQQTILLKLGENGLTGIPMEFKLGVYRHARDIYHDIGTAAQIQSEPKSQWPKWRKAFDHVLQTANVILGSTPSQIPGGEYIKEFVESVQSLNEIGGAIEEFTWTNK